MIFVNYSPYHVFVVTGCLNSVPNESTTECHPAGGSTITIHGLDFQSENLLITEVKVQVGDMECSNAVVVNDWSISCQLTEGTGEGLQIRIRLRWKDVARYEHFFHGL